MITNPILPSQAPGSTGTPGVTLIQKLVPYAIQWGFIIGAVIFFFMLLFGAIKWISSSGNKDKLQEARDTITSALIGLVVLLATFAIIQLVGMFLHVNLLEFKLPTLNTP